MKTDRELLELAAKAAGLSMKKHGPSSDGRSAALDNGFFWAPFDNDGDAFRHETKLSVSAVEWSNGIEVGELETVSRGLRFIKGRSAYVKFDDMPATSARQGVLLGSEPPLQSGSPCLDAQELPSPWPTKGRRDEQDGSCIRQAS